MSCNPTVSWIQASCCVNHLFSVFLCLARRTPVNCRTKCFCPKKMSAFYFQRRKVWFCIWQGWGSFGPPPCPRSIASRCMLSRPGTVMTVQSSGACTMLELVSCGTISVVETPETDLVRVPQPSRWMFRLVLNQTWSSWPRVINPFCDDCQVVFLFQNLEWLNW